MTSSTTTSAQLVSVVFSFRNEEAVLPALIARLHSVFKVLPERYELIFVNDDSTDQSLSVLLAERQRDPQIRIINMTRRFGVSECIMAGLSATSGEAVIYMDADLQDPPEVIPQMLDHWRNGAEIVHTIRSKRRGENPLKMWATLQAYRIVQFGSQPKLPVNAGDFKLLSRKAVEHLLRLPESDPYVRGLAVWIGHKQVFMPYERDRRYAGKTHFPFFSRNPWKTFVLGLTSFSFVPLYCILGLGFIGVFGALTAAVATVSLYFASGARIAWEWVLLTFFWGSLLVSIGIVGVYVARIYKDVRGRPRFIIRETIGFSDTLPRDR
jgi:dolichol-phosphate mannosyltransferase